MDWISPTPPPVVKPTFHDADTDILARILADTSDTRDFLKLFLRQAERHADILATILARMSARMSVSPSWNAGLKGSTHLATLCIGDGRAADNVLDELSWSSVIIRVVTTIYSAPLT